MVQQLNTEVEFVSKANAMLNPLSPKPGLLMVGDKGVEYVAEAGPGFIQIPWVNIKRIRVQMLFKGRYVRGFYFETDEGQLLEFVVDEAKDSLRAMRKHLPREKFVAQQSNLASMFKNPFKKKKQNNNEE
ncbi:DUF956 family protein [Aerococcus sp. 1KP-2016]|uniref:DUF956 family protein n=1 Tax=Aerococcus sp. 1KP-2016 TaxID=1981982 RepID=UPI000B985CA6|nr:DUF956 family protein [Aerococcus sp. 1KP-2016]OYQ67361.1 hypothetical protein B9P78_03830 [Aerococcus sp. 1KP-2016]